MGWNYLSIPKLQRCNRFIARMITYAGIYSTYNRQPRHPHNGGNCYLPRDSADSLPGRSPHLYTQHRPSRLVQNLRHIHYPRQQHQSGNLTCRRQPWHPCLPKDHHKSFPNSQHDRFPLDPRWASRCPPDEYWLLKGELPTMVLFGMLHRRRNLVHRNEVRPVYVHGSSSFLV